MWSKVGSAARPQSKERKMWAAHLRMRTPVAYPTLCGVDGAKDRSRGEIGRPKHAPYTAAGKPVTGG